MAKDNAPDLALIEMLARLAHDQWAGWTQHMIKNWDARHPVTGEHYRARWIRQIDTSYADLSEPEKESDRVEARRVAALFAGTEGGGGAITTYTGRTVHPAAPDPATLNIADIAHALSMLCRFNGHLKEFYSVAQHCVLVSRVVPPEHARWGLLHDAPEAYLGDLMSPIKQLPPFHPYRAVEGRLMGVIVAAFRLDPTEQPDSVSVADIRMRRTEIRDLRKATKPGVKYPPDEGSYTEFGITPWPPGIAEVRFLERFAELS